MQAAFHLAFREAKAYGLVIHEFRIIVNDSDILVDSSGERAAVENVKFYISGSYLRCSDFLNLTAAISAFKAMEIQFDGPKRPDLSLSKLRRQF